jgi:DNA polymerase (family 10)
MDHFIKYEDVVNVIAEGVTKSSVLLSSGMQVDARVVADECFGAALHYFTGNKEHNIRVRDLAKKKKLKINEYGVFRGKKLIGGKVEAEIFSSAGLPYMIPEIRKNDGEIEYGLSHKKFPRFIELKDIKGDLHVHSTYSDGENSVEEMIRAMIEKGYSYFAFADHSSLVGVTNGMGTADIKKQWKEIDKMNKKYGKKIHILKSSEVDILKDGSLDFKDTVLKELDLVIIAAHLYFRLSAREQTKRLITAIENPYATILAHPSGRLLNKRPPMEFDMEKIIDACASNSVALEICASPLRLDLTDKYIRIAKDKRVKLAINTDAHNSDQLEFMKFGVGVARRGWLEKDDVINTKSFKGLTSILRKV